MQALEFETYIENGQIVLPPLFSKIKQKVKIILLWQDSPPPSEDRFARLKQTMLDLQALHPFTAISDPVEWQKQQRNEWESIDR